MKQHSNQKLNVDLHTHTLYSDGVTTPEQNVYFARLHGLDAIAICDHDTTIGLAQAQRAADTYGIELLPAVEISTARFHILAYNIDQNSASLQELLRANRNASEAEVSEKIHKLNECGYAGSLASLHEYNGSSSQSGHRIGSVNLGTMLLRANPEQLASHSNYDVRQIVTKTTKGIQGVYPSERSVIKTIHDAGGLAFLAHGPRNGLTFEVLTELCSYGLDGVEIQPNEYTKKKGRESLSYSDLEQFAKRGLTVSVGSDFHGPTMRRPFLEKGTYPIPKFW